MPKVSCPECTTQYSVPASAAGQSATCKKCGKRFRIGRANSDSNILQTPSGQAAKPVESEPGAVEEKKPSPSVAKSARTNSSSSRSGLYAASGRTTPKAPEKPEFKKKKAKKRKVRWGFDWGKVGGGLLTFFVAGGITASLFFTTGRLTLWGAGAAVVGLFTALSGLMGEEGVW